MKWLKDRKEAFLWAAEAFGTPYKERTKKQKDLTSAGFCWAVSVLTGSREIHRWAFNFGDRVGIEDVYWWSQRDSKRWSPACDNERSLFCCMMAQLSDKEFEEISG